MAREGRPAVRIIIAAASLLNFGSIRAPMAS